MNDKQRIEAIYKSRRWHKSPPLWFVAGALFACAVFALMEGLLWAW